MGMDHSGERGNLLDSIIRRDYTRVCEHFRTHCLNSDKIAVWFFHRWDPASGRFILVHPALEGPNSELSAEVRTRLENRKYVVDNNVPEIYGGWGNTETYPVTVVVPLVYNSELIGAVQGFSTGSSDLREEVLFRPGGLSLMAQSWYLVGLLEEKEKLAFTDSLTGLYNYQFLRQFLQSELMRCSRYRKSASLVFLDIDWFKRVNDAHGHLVGSYVLKEIGRLLRGQVREADIVSRYGGDEYVIVLTETGILDAHGIAERLRQLVSAYVFGQKQGLSIHLTISAGVAGFPEHGLTADDLMRRADLAMYQAKESDKNCVKMAV